MIASQITWHPMPLLPRAAVKSGIFPGGEGAQWPRGPIAVSPADPDFLLLPIDVGGVYRSLDGGKNWQIAMVGWDARGANGFAIDPRNANRVVGIAANSMNWESKWGASPNGLYLSTNKAASWKHVLATPEGIGGRIAFDPTSYDTRRGFCVVAYYLSADNGLLRSNDGGENWARLKTAPELGTHLGGDWSEGLQTAPRLVVDTKSGAVYLGGARGLFRSDDQGNTWKHRRTEPVYSLCIGFSIGLYDLESTVFISDPNHVLASKDGGKTFFTLPSKGLKPMGDGRIQDLVISPIDARRMLCWVSGKNFIWTRYVTEDGGTTWQKVALEKSDAATLPQNAREGYAVWSPRDPKVAWSIGGDWVTKSTDGGKSFQWSNNGCNGIMAGGFFNFSVQEPSRVFIGFQDYNGAFTQDGGKTWNYRDVSGKGWGGHEYGAFAATGGKVLWAGDAESWGSPRRLRISRDGGTTWIFVPDSDGKPLEFHGPDTSLEDPTNPQIFFASDLRSPDGGVTWERMTACDGVFTTAAGYLYGKKGDFVVRSTDQGVTWEKVVDIKVEGGFVDLAVDPKRAKVYVASQDALKVWEGRAWIILSTPKDQFGNARVWTVAVDPVRPEVLYVGGPRNTYASNATVCRSTDSGKTWQNLTVTTPLKPGQSGGPHEVSCIRVHPETHEAWIAGQCFGLWRIAAPIPSETGLPAEQASSKRSITASTINK